MHIDSTRLMYSVFQSCRHGLHYSGTQLELLLETLDIVKQQRVLFVNVDDNWVKQHELESLAVAPLARLTRNDALSSANQPLFMLIDVGAHDLQRLWSAEAVPVVRRLGYAFHILPALLWKPQAFKPDLYMFCFRMVGLHWAELSSELRQAFCALQGLTLDEAARLIEENHSGD